MAGGRINRILPTVPIIERRVRPSYILNEPVPRVRDMLDLQERMHQAELDAHLWCAYMKHQRNLLDIILKGMNHT